MNLKQTPLYNQHKQLGAKLVDFSGYSMPVWYTNAKEEHLSVRQHVGMFDISHMGMVVFQGKDVFNILQQVCTNDIQKTQPNKIIYTMILNNQGGVLDDVMVGFNAQWQSYFMIINASNKDKILGWLMDHGCDAAMVDARFDSHGLVAIQGPKALDTVNGLFDIDWEALGRFQSQVFMYNGQECMVMRTGYTGEDGIEISAPNHVMDAIWTACLDAGVRPCGLAARDSLRIESGLPLYGHELSEDITPLQTRYRWVLKWGTQFIGESHLSNIKDTVDTCTVGLKFHDRCIPRQGYALEEGGVITSGSFSPVLDCPIAIAMVPLALNQEGASVTVDIRGRKVSASVVAIPFV
jgi:aminomethyltransferase